VKASFLISLPTVRVLVMVLFFGFLWALPACKNQYLRGTFDKQSFVDSCQWRTSVRENYKPDPVYFDSLRSVAPFDVKLFLGTWCSDSRRWVPRFLSYSDSLPIGKLEIIAVDTTKKDAGGLWKTYAIDSVPAFVFLRNDKIIGKMTTKPYKRRLEKELYYILK